MSSACRRDASACIHNVVYLAAAIHGARELGDIRCVAGCELSGASRHGEDSEAAFSFLSGNGADPTGRSRMAFARYKDEAEKALLAAGFPHVYILRPAYIYPVEPRREPNFNYRLLRVIYPSFRLLFPNQVIRSDDLARAMVDVAMQRTGEQRSLVFENRDIRAMIDSRRRGE
jgi:uncharacterized protein YbjT (DUF2867 family)